MSERSIATPTRSKKRQGRRTAHPMLNGGTTYERSLAMPCPDEEGIETSCTSLSVGSFHRWSRDAVPR